MKRVYIIDKVFNGECQFTERRYKRDAAALLFERTVYDATAYCGLLDRQAGHNAMDLAKRARLDLTMRCEVAIGDWLLVFTVAEQA